MYLGSKINNKKIVKEQLEISLKSNFRRGNYNSEQLTLKKNGFSYFLNWVSNGGVVRPLGALANYLWAPHYDHSSDSEYRE